MTESESARARAFATIACCALSTLVGCTGGTEAVSSNGGTTATDSSTGRGPSGSTNDGKGTAGAASGTTGGGGTAPGATSTGTASSSSTGGATSDSGTTSGATATAGGSTSTTGATAGGSSSGGASGSTGAATGGSRDAGAADASRGDAALAPIESGTATGYPDASAQHFAVGVHDPSLIHVGQRWYLFGTGGTLSIRSTADLLGGRWSNGGNVFSSIPSWIANGYDDGTKTIATGISTDSLWAPDISYFDGLYHVYYAGSTFGSNHSVIGLATNTTLDPSAPGYLWVDEGLVVESNVPGGAADNWNAIDPSIAFDAAGQPWLVWGSFWSGIKLRQIDPATGKFSTANTTMYSLATASGSHGPEAPSIIQHGGYYYLFVSFDTCCQGVNSTYNTRMGRASAINGPYTDRMGRPMTSGNAEIMIQTQGRYIGPGGGTAFQDGNQYYYVYHYYDGQANGASNLMVRPITFTADDWINLGDQLWQ